MEDKNYKLVNRKAFVDSVGIKRADLEGEFLLQALFVAFGGE